MNLGIISVHRKSWWSSPAFYSVGSVALLIGCFGSIDDGVLHRDSDPSGTDGDPVPGLIDPNSCQVSASPAAMRLLTAYEYDRTVSDLLAQPLFLSEAFLADGRRDMEHGEGFPTNVDLDMDRARLVHYRRAAEQLGQIVRDRARELAECGDDTDTACLDDFLRTFGRRVFRRPLSSTETDGLSAVYSTTDGSFEDGIALVATAMFQSIPFLYHVEAGDPARANDGFRELTPYEVAGRLSYLLWGTTPSDELLDAAQAGELLDGDGIRSWALHLLEDQRAREHVVRLHEEWLGIENLGKVIKTDDVLDGTPDDLITSMSGETRALIERVVFDGNGSLDALLSTDVSFIDASLSELYGVPTVAGQPVAWGEQPRTGLLTHASWLMRHSGADETLPTKRGKFIVNELLCENIQLPPNLDVPSLGAAEEFRTTRERFESHSEMPCAVACHGLMDPIGFAFENFDPLGRYRTTENGYPINASGAVSIADVDVAFQNAKPLVDAIASSERADRCFASRVFEIAMGRRSLTQDNCSVALIGKNLSEHESIRQLLVDIATSHAFRSKAVCP